MEFVFDHDLSKKLIMIGASKVHMDLPNGTSIAQQKVTMLLYGGKKNFSTAQYSGFVMETNDASKNHSGKK